MTESAVVFARALARISALAPLGATAGASADSPKRDSSTVRQCHRSKRRHVRKRLVAVTIDLCLAPRKRPHRLPVPGCRGRPARTRHRSGGAPSPYTQGGFGSGSTVNGYLPTPPSRPCFPRWAGRRVQSTVASGTVATCNRRIERGAVQHGAETPLIVRSPLRPPSRVHIPVFRSRTSGTSRGDQRSNSVMSSR